MSQRTARQARRAGASAESFLVRGNQPAHVIHARTGRYGFAGPRESTLPLSPLARSGTTKSFQTRRCLATGCGRGSDVVWGGHILVSDVPVGINFPRVADSLWRDAPVGFFPAYELVDLAVRFVGLLHRPGRGSRPDDAVVAHAASVLGGWRLHCRFDRGAGHWPRSAGVLVLQSRSLRSST
jgi:hypothetical protein